MAREELENLLSGRIPQDPIEELLDGPFLLRAKLRNKRRFSDGTYPVFYSALSLETASAEVAYWFRESFVKIREQHLEHITKVFAAHSKVLRKTCVPKFATGQI